MKLNTLVFKTDTPMKRRRRNNFYQIQKRVYNRIKMNKFYPLSVRNFQNSICRFKNKTYMYHIRIPLLPREKVARRAPKDNKNKRSQTEEFYRNRFLFLVRSHSANIPANTPHKVVSLVRVLRVA